MRKLLFTFFCCLLALSAPASIVDFYMTNWIAGGGPLTNGLKISPVGPPVVNGIYLQMGRPTWIYPNATTGKASTNFNVGVYQIEVYGFTFQKPIYMPVPNDNAEYNATDLITNGVASASGMAASSVSQIIAGSGIGVSPSSGLGNVIVNIAERVPIGNAPTNTVLYTTNIVVMTRGEDFNHFVIVGAGTSFVNGTNYTLKTTVGNVTVYTNDTGTAGVLEDPDGDVFWSLTNSAGLELYNGNGPGQQWTRTGGLNPAPSATLSGYGFSTNSFTNFVSTIALPWTVSQTNLLFVSPLGNDYSAVRGDPTHPWKHVARAYTNMLYQFDVMAIQPGVFDERAELNNSMPQLPANCVIYGSGRGVSKIIGSQNNAKFTLGNSNRMEHLSLQACWIYTASASSTTNVVVQDVEANADGDVWVSDQGAFYAWDPFIIDCDFSGNSDKIAVLESATLPGQTNSHIYIINTRISGGSGADGDGMNRGFTTADGVRAGQFVTLGTHVMVTGKTNSTFMGLSSQVSTSGTFTATGPGFIGPGPGITALNAGNASSGTLPAGRLPAFTGDVTSSAGSAATTIAAAAVTYAKIQNVSATQRALGRNSASAGVTEEVTATQLLDWIGSTRGSVLYRGASAWSPLTPGTSGTFLQSAGAGADPVYAVPSGYVLTLLSAGSGTPSTSTTYYIGGDPNNGANTTYGIARVEVPRAGTIKRVFLKVRVAGTLGTSESVNHFIRINDTTDVGQITTGYNSATADVNNTSVSQAVVAGDFLALKIVTPSSWATSPTTVRWYCEVYIE